MRSFTIDASVWVAAFETRDRFHDESVELLRTMGNKKVRLLGPAIVILEVSCAVSRRARSAAIGESAGVRLRAHPLLLLRAVDEELLVVARQLGTESFLRAADALYLATALLEDSPLVTWDSELLNRTDAVSPEQLLATMR